jgi:hypothetical protein
LKCIATAKHAESIWPKTNDVEKQGSVYRRESFVVGRLWFFFDHYSWFYIYKALLNQMKTMLEELEPTTDELQNTFNGTLYFLHLMLMRCDAIFCLFFFRIVKSI